MHSVRRALGPICLLALAAMLMSCGTEQKAAKKVRIGIVTNASSPFWTAMQVGMRRAADRLGCEATCQLNPKGKVDDQRRLLEDYAAKGVKAISVSPVDPRAVGPVIDDLVRRGCIVVTMDSDAPQSKRVAYIGTDNYKAGQECGRQALRVCAPGTKVVAFVGYMSAMNAQQRLQGFKDATKAVLEVVDVVEDQTDKAKAQTNAQDVLQSRPEVGCLLGLWSYNAPAIANAVESARKLGKVKIVCFDAEEETLNKLVDGKIDVTIVQKPYMFGYLSVMVLRDMATLGVKETLAALPKGGIIDTGVTVVTPKNARAFRQQLNKLGVKSS